MQGIFNFRDVDRFPLNKDLNIDRNKQKHLLLCLLLFGAWIISLPVFLLIVKLISGWPESSFTIAGDPDANHHEAKWKNFISSQFNSYNLLFRTIQLRLFIDIYSDKKYFVTHTRFKLYKCKKAPHALSIVVWRVDPWLPVTLNLVDRSPALQQLQRNTGSQWSNANHH